jgi:hypothetical protein
MTRKQQGATASLAEQKFNELDNWLGVMDLDPPKSPEEKQVMYGRLMEILEKMFRDPHSSKVEHSSHSAALNSLDDKRIFYRDLRRLIPR